MKKFICVALIAGALAACDDKKIASQESTQTVRYGHSHVAFLTEPNTPPGCQIWNVHPYRVDKETGLKVIPGGSSAIAITVCQGEGQPSKTSWQERVGKTSVTRETFTNFLPTLPGAP